MDDFQHSLERMDPNSLLMELTNCKLSRALSNLPDCVLLFAQAIDHSQTESKDSIGCLMCDDGNALNPVKCMTCATEASS